MPGVIESGLPAVAAVVLGCFLTNFLLRICINRYFTASDQNSDIDIRFSDSNFLKRDGRHFHAVTLTFEVCSRLGVTWSNSLPNMTKIKPSAAKLFQWLRPFSPLCHVVTFTFDPLARMCFSLTQRSMGIPVVVLQCYRWQDIPME